MHILSQFCTFFITFEHRSRGVIAIYGSATCWTCVVRACMSSLNVKVTAFMPWLTSAVYDISLCCVSLMQPPARCCCYRRWQAAAIRCCRHWQPAVKAAFDVITTLRCAYQQPHCSYGLCSACQMPTVCVHALSVHVSHASPHCHSLWRIGFRTGVSY